MIYSHAKTATCSRRFSALMSFSEPWTIYAEHLRIIGLFCAFLPLLCNIIYLKACHDRREKCVCVCVCVCVCCE